jgi:Zn-dependent protease
MSYTLFSLVIMLFSIMLHEIAHGAMALRLGDTTAKYAGRLTLNPLKHIDPFGTIFLPLFLTVLNSPFILGWAKPVPVNPYNFKDQRWGMFKVSLAGPATNFITALVFGLIVRFIPLPATMETLFGIIIIYNFAWALFNLIPVSPFDGSHIFFSFLPNRFKAVQSFLQQYGVFIFLGLLFLGVIDYIFQISNYLYYLVAIA